MRRLFVVLALLAMMAGLRALQTQTSQPDHDPLTLAALGFVVLAAFALAELGERLHLPKVTGYIVTGLLLGPQALDVLSPQVVADMRMIDGLALGLIAMSAGLGLDARAIGRRWRSLAVTIGAKIVLLPLTVGFAFVAVQTTWAPLPLESTATVLGMAAIFAALALGTSAPISFAVLSETGAKGPLAELALGMAVLKDVAVAVCLAVATAVSLHLVDPTTGLDAAVLLDVARRLGTELVLGGVLAGLLGLYMRFVGKELLLFAVAAVLVVTLVCKALAVQPLLAFIATGFVIRNLTPYGGRLVHPLEVVALPVFVVFFTNAGASVSVAGTLAVLPFALVLCAARAAAFWVAARAGAAWGGESPVVQRLAWLAYLPQAGVTLGVVGIASLEVPGLSPEVVELGVAVVAINLLVGPVALRGALERAGELPTAARAEATVEAEAGAAEGVPRRLPDELEAPALRELLVRLHEQLMAPWTRWRHQELRPAAERWRRSLGTPVEARGGEAGAAVVQRALERVALEDQRDRAAGLHDVIARQLEHLRALPQGLAVPLEARNARASLADPWRTRWLKRLATVSALLRGRARRRTRRVPVQIAARTALEPAMARVAEESLRDWQRFEVECLEVLEHVALGTEPWAEVADELQERERLLLHKLAGNAEATLWAAMRELARRLAVAGAPGEPAPARYSSVERELQASLRRLDEDAAAWPSRRRAAVERLRFSAEAELVEHRVRVRLRQEVVEPLDAAFARVGELVAEELRRLDGLPRAAALEDADAWARAEAQARAVLPKPVVKELRALVTRVRRATSGDAAGAELRAFMGEGEEQLTVVASLSALAQAPRPAQAELAVVDARELEEVQLAGHVLPTVEECLSDAAAAFSAVRDQMHEVESLAEFGLESARRSMDEGGPATALDEALERGHAMLQALQVGACQGWQATRPRLLEAVTGMAAQLSELVTVTAGGEQGRTAGARVGRVARLRLRAQRITAQVLAFARGVIRTLRTGEVGQAAEDLALRYRLRVGHQRLDALAIRSFLDDQRALRRTRLSGLPGSLFTTEPLRDPRLFVANREALATIVRAERAWQAQPAAGNAVLVVGAAGTGKSSTIGIAQLKLATRRVISVRPLGDQGRQDGDGTSLRAAVARALGVADEEAMVQASLRSAPTTVVVDDLQQFFAPSDEGLAALETFVALVVASQGHTFWLLAMAEESLAVWQGLVPLDDAFPCRVQLQGPDPAQLREILEARRELGGQRCEYPVPRYLGKLARRSPQDAYVRRLAAASSGSLRRALALWRAHAEPDGELLRLRPLASLSWRLPFVQQLREEAQAILTLLVRHARLPRPEIALALGVSEDDVEVHLRFLVASGLVELAAGRYAITELVIDDVAFALREAGAIGGGAA